MSPDDAAAPSRIDPTGTDARAPFPVEIAAPAVDAAPDPTGTHAAPPLTRPVTALAGDDQ